MAASYPAAPRSFTTKIDVTDIVYGAHVNDLQDEVVAIESTLGVNPHQSSTAGSFATVDARLEAIESGKSDTTHNHAHNSLTGLTTGDPHTQYLLRSVLTTKGDVFVYNGSTIVRLGVGSNDQVLIADSAQAAGVKWGTLPTHNHDHNTLTNLTTGDPHTQYVLESVGTTKGDLIGFSGSATPVRVPAGSEGYVPVARAAAASGIAWEALPAATNDVPVSVFDAAGDLVRGTGNDTYARLARGSANQVLRTNAGGTDIEYATVTAVFYTTHTWAIAGTVSVPSGDTDYIPPMFVGDAGTTHVVVLDKVRMRINSGTSVTFNMALNGATATGFGGISATTTSGVVDPADVTLAEGDLLAPVVTAVAGTPKNLTVTAVFRHTVSVV